MTVHSSSNTRESRSSRRRRSFASRLTAFERGDGYSAASRSWGDMRRRLRFLRGKRAPRAAQHVAVPDADEEGAVDEFGEPLDLPLRPDGLRAEGNRVVFELIGRLLLAFSSAARSAARSPRASSGFRSATPGLRLDGRSISPCRATPASTERSSTPRTARSSTAVSWCREVGAGKHPHPRRRRPAEMTSFPGRSLTMTSRCHTAPPGL